MSLWPGRVEPTRTNGGTEMDQNGKVEIADFSFAPEPKRFRINDDIFECSPELPLGVLEMAANLNINKETLKTEGIEPVLKFMDEIFIGDSGQRFRERTRDKARPISLRHINAIIPWILEVYGLRPTEPSESSSTSPDSTGTTSTDGAPHEESTLSSSESLASSTSSTTTSAPSPSVS